MQGAPHPPPMLMADSWTKPYTRDYAAFPAPWLRSAKFWPVTGELVPFCCFLFLYNDLYPLTQYLWLIVYQHVSTTCMEIVISSALFFQYHRWLKSRLRPVLNATFLSKNSLFSSVLSPLSHASAPFPIPVYKSSRALVGLCDMADTVSISYI